MPMLEAMQAQKIQGARGDTTFTPGQKIGNKNFEHRSAISLSSSFLTHLDQIVETIFQKIKGFFSSIFICNDLSLIKPDVVDYNTEKLNKFLQAAERFQTPGKKINTSSFKAYLETFNTSRAVIVENLLHGLGGTLEAIDEAIDQVIKEDKKSFISIPIVSKGHIVHLLIEFTYDGKAEIEFFDSFGRGSSSYQAENGNVNDLIKQIKNKLKNKGLSVAEPHRENDAIVQQNKHDCGVYVAAYLERRIANNASLPQILQIFATNNSTTLRNKQARALRNKALEAADNEVARKTEKVQKTSLATPVERKDAVYPGFLSDSEVVS